MMRRMAVGSIAAALIVLVVAGCGGSEASPSASAAATQAAPVATAAPLPTEAPTPGQTEAPATAGTVRLTALCAGVGVRKDPAPDGELIVRVAKGATVRVVETVTGDPYEAGACGESGDDWLKIDRINGKSIQALYGAPFGYAAGGFFE